MDTLEGIADWLQETSKLFHMTNTLVRNLDLFHNLCGNDAFCLIQCCTCNNMQGSALSSGFSQGHQKRNKYWHSFLDTGSKIARFENTHSSAWNVIDSLPLDPIALREEKFVGHSGQQIYVLLVSSFHRHSQESYSTV